MNNLATIASLAQNGGRASQMPAETLLMQDENSGRDGRRYNEWFASRPDARLRAREAAQTIQLRSAYFQEQLDEEAGC